MTLSNLRIPLASASSSTVLPTHTTVKGIRRMLPRHTGLNASVSIHQTVSPLCQSLLPPPNTSTLPLPHFERRLSLASMLLSPHGYTLLPAILSLFRARIPPDFRLFRSISPLVPKLPRLPAQCLWIPQQLVALPSKSSLLPFRAMFLWNLLQIPLLNPPILPSACDRPSPPSLVLHPMVQIHRDVNVIRLNPRLLLLSSKIQFS